MIVTDLSVILFDLTTHLKLWSILYSHIEAIDSRDKDILIKIKSSKKAFGVINLYILGKINYLIEFINTIIE